MKHNKLHSIAHNYTDSLVCDFGLLLGYHYPTNVFADAAANGKQGLVVDFLTGRVHAKQYSEDLSCGIPLYRNKFAEFCEKHGADNRDFHMFRVRFEAKGQGGHYIVTIKDSAGKCSSRNYERLSGKRVKLADSQGRLRPEILTDPDAETLGCDILRE